MLRLPNRQALKALCNPIRTIPPDPLRGRPQARYHHNCPPPFAGPPSYATLARRFSSSNPSPISYFAQERAKDARERGEFVDIHDIGGVDPKDFDVLITDVNNDTLHFDISKLVGIPYLKEATKDESDKVAETVHGFVYGRKFRMILPCVVGIEDRARWVFFIVDGGAPLTYISAQVAEAFGLNKDDDPWIVKIAGLPHQVYMAPPESHFSSINILGNDFCTLNRLRPWVDDNHRAVTYYIGKKWEVNSKL